MISVRLSALLLLRYELDFPLAHLGRGYGRLYPSVRRLGVELGRWWVFLRDVGGLWRREVESDASLRTSDSFFGQLGGPRETALFHIVLRWGWGKLNVS